MDRFKELLLGKDRCKRYYTLNEIEKSNVQNLHIADRYFKAS